MRFMFMEELRMFCYVARSQQNSCKTKVDFVLLWGNPDDIASS